VVTVLEQVATRLGQRLDWPSERLARWGTPSILNTRGEVVGAIAVRGALKFV
jgi:hypothetical protein